MNVSPPASGWSSLVAGETVTASVAVGRASLPVGARFVGFKLFYRPEAYDLVSRSVGPLVSSYDFDDSDGTSDGFRVFRHDVNIYGSGRNAISFSVALFDGAPLIQTDGRVAISAVLRLKATSVALYDVVVGEAEVRDGNGALLSAPSATVRLESLGAGDPAALVVPEAGGFAVDASALGSAATSTISRSEDALTGTALPGAYTSAATGSWSLALSPTTTFAGRVCVPTAHITVGTSPYPHVRVLQRADAASAWNVLPTQLLPDAVSPSQVCGDASAPGEFTLANDPSALPVELVAFTAAQDGGDVLLRWATASETNNAGFSIEQQRGASWGAVGFEPARGEATGAAYTFRLRAATPGAYRFRLRQVDLDGTSTYSPEVSLTLDPGGDGLSAPLPHPVSATGRLRFRLAEAGPVHLAVYSIAGREQALLQQAAMPAGFHAAAFDASAWPAGLYLVRLRTATSVTTAPLIVVH